MREERVLRRTLRDPRGVCLSPSSNSVLCVGLHRKYAEMVPTVQIRFRFAFFGLLSSEDSLNQSRSPKLRNHAAGWSEPKGSSGPNVTDNPPLGDLLVT